MCSEHLESTLHENEKEKKKDIKNFSHQLIGEREREREALSSEDPLSSHTHTHTRSVLTFRICVTNMYFATDSISVMLGSVTSVLCCQRAFYCLHSDTHTHTHTTAVNISQEPEL